MLVNISTLLICEYIYYVKHICLQPTASTLCMKQYILCQAHMFATKRINIMYEYISCMPHICLQPNASILLCMNIYYVTHICLQTYKHYLCMKIYYACQTHTLAIKRINMMCAYIMYAKHICLQTHVWMNIYYACQAHMLANAST